VRVAGTALVLGVLAFLTSLSYSLGHNTVGNVGSGDDLMTLLGLIGAIMSIAGAVILAIRPMLKRVNAQVCDINDAVNNAPTTLSDRIDEVLVDLKMNSKMVGAISQSQANLSLEVLSLSTRLDEHMATTNERK